MAESAYRWYRIQTLFHDALDHPDADRRAFVEASCGDDTALAAEVLAMLREDARHASMLDRNMAHVAHHLLDHSPDTPLPAMQFGPYRITRLLGEGGMGVVYLAHRDDLGSAAAVKILRDAWLSPARRDRFTSEQRTLAQLNHPSIARLYDSNTLPDGTPWFVMEYVDGVPLTEYCQRYACTPNERVRLARAVCDAVQYAHGQAIVHRDLKPSNILVTADGTVKLLDFGIAKQLDSLNDTTQMTRTGLRFMTPAYASPEQLRGSGVGTHSDVYALGVILYELLTGQLPFDLSHRTPGEIEQTIMTADAHKPSFVARRGGYVAGYAMLAGGLGKSQWADLDVLCLTAMQKDPARRYRSVEALARDIDHYLQGEPLEARADSVQYRVGKFLRRNWRPVAAASLVAAGVIGTAAFYAISDLSKPVPCTVLDARR